MNFERPIPECRLAGGPSNSRIEAEGYAVSR
jgi:hypothetical protein